MTQRSSSRRMKQLREDFFQQGKALDAVGDPAADCWICGQSIDYDAAPHSTPDSHNLDHYYPVSERPDLQEDPTNFRHSHRRCNETRGAGAPSTGLGTPVPQWW